MNMQVSLPVLVVLVGCIWATVSDLKYYKIYNALTLPLLSAGLLFHLLSSGLGGLGQSTVGMLFGFGLLFVPYLIGVIGGGDVKMLAAIGAWLGLESTAVVAGIACTAAALYSLVLLAKQGRLRDSWTGLQMALVRFNSLAGQLGCEDEREDFKSQVRESVTTRRRAIPFSIMFAFGVIAVAGFHLWTHPS